MFHGSTIKPQVVLSRLLLATVLISFTGIDISFSKAKNSYDKKRSRTIKKSNYKRTSSLKKSRKLTAKYKKIKRIRKLQKRKRLRARTQFKIAKLKVWQLKLLPKKDQYKYLMLLRKALIKMEKAQIRKEHRSRYSDNSFLNFLNRVLATDAHANEWGFRSPGNTCLYNGWPGEYQMRDGWTRPYCVRKEAQNWEELRTTYGEQVSCSEGEMLCNPLLFGLGSGGTGYCAPLGQRGFKSCQDQYIGDTDNGGYKAEDIAKLLVEKGRYEEMVEFNQSVATYCGGENAQGRICGVIERRTTAIIAKAESMPRSTVTISTRSAPEVEEDGTDVAADAGDRTPAAVTPEVTRQEPINLLAITPPSGDIDLTAIPDVRTATEEPDTSGADTENGKRNILVIGDSHLTAGGTEIGLGTTLAEGLSGNGHDVRIHGSPGSAPSHWCSGDHTGLHSRHQWDGTSYSRNSGSYNSVRAGGRMSEAIEDANTVVVELGDNLLGLAGRDNGEELIAAQYTCLIEALNAHPRNSDIQCIFVTPTGWGKPSERTTRIVNGIKRAAGDRCSVIDSTALLPAFDRPDIGDVHLPPSRYQEWGRTLVSSIQQSIDLHNRQTTPGPIVAANECTTNCTQTQ